MKYLNILVKIAMFLGTLAYAALALLGGWLFSGSTGLMGSQNTLGEQQVGKIWIFLGFTMVVVSPFIFKRKNLKFLIALLFMAGLIYLTFASVEGTGNEADLFAAAYAIGMLILYRVSKSLEKYLGTQSP